MSTSILKNLALLVLVGVVAYNSVYVKKLDEVKKAAGSNLGQAFNAATYAETFWSTKLIPATQKSVTDLTTLMALLKTDKEKALTTYSHALGIGNIRYFLVKGEGTITAISDEDVTVLLPDGESVKLATEYIFGNAVRDASGLIQITEFDNTMDLNNVSSAINDIIRRKVIPVLKSRAKKGDKVNFVGAIELNREHLHLDNLEVVPITVK
jgi:predicted lipoprotein